MVLCAYVNSRAKEMSIMKRTPLSQRQLPDYTRGEEICNMVTHIVGGALGILAVVLCVIIGAKNGKDDYNPNTNPNYRDVVIPPKYKYAQITHFSTKSTEEYVNKIKRGYPGGYYPEVLNRVNMYFFHNRFTKEKLKIFEDSFNMTFPKYHE